MLNLLELIMYSIGLTNSPRFSLSLPITSFHALSKDRLEKISKSRPCAKVIFLVLVNRSICMELNISYT